VHNTVATTSAIGQLRGLVALMRPKQWVKNGFVLAPLIFTGQFLNGSAISAALHATLFFCIASSAIYIVNDLGDMQRDRLHPVKSRTRPLAAGIVSIPAALALLVSLCVLLIWGWFLAPNVALVITAYLLLNIAYTFVLKHQPVIDIFTIAVGFVLRVYAGAEALEVAVSPWMFVTTLCLALYLAATKRKQELLLAGTAGRNVLIAYSLPLIDKYVQISATGALFFYSMFVMSSKPQLVFTVPLVLFGLFRHWYIVEKNDGGESPAEDLLSDWQLMVTVFLWVGACILVMWPFAS
jgi:decaprenyl-phosphate phosphoribosyltransferase